MPDRAPELALGAGQVPPIELPRRRRGRRGRPRATRWCSGRCRSAPRSARPTGRAAWRRARRRAGARRRPARSSTRATSTRSPLATSKTRAVRWSESPAWAKSPSTTVQTPASRASRRASSSPTSSPGRSLCAASRSCSRSWSTTVQVVPLREVERQHADAAVAQPVDGAVVAQVVERQDQDRVPRVDAVGGPGDRRASPNAPAPSASATRDAGQHAPPPAPGPRCRLLAQPAPAGTPRRSASGRPAASRARA